MQGKIRFIYVKATHTRLKSIWDILESDGRVYTTCKNLDDFIRRMRNSMLWMCYSNNVLIGAVILKHLAVPTVQDKSVYVGHLIFSRASHRYVFECITACNDFMFTRDDLPTPRVILCTFPPKSTHITRLAVKSGYECIGKACDIFLYGAVDDVVYRMNTHLYNTLNKRG